MAAKEYNAEIGILAPSEENDVERQNELLKEAIEKKPDAILFHRPVSQNRMPF